MFQKAVTNKYYAIGFSGEFYSNQPQRTRGIVLRNAQGKVARSGLVANHIESDSYCAGIGQSGDIAGIIGAPKSTTRVGLTPTVELFDGQQVEMIQQGYVIIDCIFRPNARGHKGDWCYYNPMTGEITSFAPTQTPTQGYKRLYGATIDVYAADLTGKQDGNVYQAVIYIDLAGDRSEKK